MPSERDTNIGCEDRCVISMSNPADVFYRFMKYMTVFGLLDLNHTWTSGGTHGKVLFSWIHISCRYYIVITSSSIHKSTHSSEIRPFS